MAETMVKLIESVVNWLPDMDIAFNEDDECRLVIPWSEKQELLRREEESRNIGRAGYTNWFPETEWFGTDAVRAATDDQDYNGIQKQILWNSLFNLYGGLQ